MKNQWIQWLKKELPKHNCRLHEGQEKIIDYTTGKVFYLMEDDIGLSPETLVAFMRRRKAPSMYPYF